MCHRTNWSQGPIGRPEVSPASHSKPQKANDTGLLGNRDDGIIMLGYSPHWSKYRRSSVVRQPQCESWPRYDNAAAMCQGTEMVLAKLRKKLSSTVSELDQARLQDRFADHDAIAIGDAPLRENVRLVGEAQEIRVVPRSGSSSVEVTLSDGTGRVIAVFTGRTQLPGLKLGGGFLVEGVGRLEHNRFKLLNPSYTLL